jgi:nucleotide-binding universal stress UspA family protein
MTDVDTSDRDAAGGRPTPGPVVVGVDGSANSRRALNVAAELARNSGAELIAVHSLGLMAVLDGEHVPASEHREEIAEALRSRWCSVLEAADVTWSCRLVDGNPAESLLTTATAEGASYVVVGSRGVGGHPDLMLGSTSHQVIQHTGCPAVVVPPVGRTVAAY